MKTQFEFLKELLSALNQTGISYMITGSLASTYYGRPRTTQDVDLVIEAEKIPLRAFVDTVRKLGYYADPDDAADALLHRSMFNIIDPESGYKLDAIIRKDREYSSEEFKRRKKVILHGETVFMATPEDAILSKLEWSRESQSERQFLDALGIVLMEKDSLDLPYLKRWASSLGLSADLARLWSKADSSGVRDEEQGPIPRPRRGEAPK